MSTFTLVFLLMLGMTVAVRLWLARRHLVFVQDHRNEVPAAFRERITLEGHRKAADYTCARTGLGRWEVLYETLILLGWTLGGGMSYLDALWRQTGLSPLATGVGFLLGMGVISAALELPFSSYRTFVIEQRFGFNRTTPRLFVVDAVKHLILMLVLGGLLAAGVLWTLLHTGGLWWLYAWGLWLGFSLLMLWAWPVFIAPLFNTFSPLEDAEVRNRVEGLLKRNGLLAGGIFVMDGSRRSGHGNAYFTGFGHNKRIVFFDTLLEKLAPDEIEAVLAHEIGHYRRHHIRKRVTATALLSLAGLALLGYLAQQDWFYAGLGVDVPSGHTALALFMLVSPVFTFFMSPMMAWFSRKHEFEADDFAAAESDAGTLVRALVKLYSENASTLTPDPLYSAFYDSHPPAPVRVAHLSA